MGLLYLSFYLLMIYLIFGNTTFSSSLSIFILWHVWKARNASKFDFVAFIADGVVYRVVSDLKLTILLYVLNHLSWVVSWIFIFRVGLRIILRPCRPVRLVSWSRPLSVVVKLSVDGFSCGNLSSSTVGGVVRDH